MGPERIGILFGTRVHVGEKNRIEEQVSICGKASFDPLEDDCIVLLEEDYEDDVVTRGNEEVGQICQRCLKVLEGGQYER